MENILTKDQILQADDKRTEHVKVPEWITGDCDTVIIRTLTGNERDQFEDSIMRGDKRDFKGIRSKLVALSVVDENGERLFTFEDAKLLGEKSARALDRVFAAAQRLSGFTQKDMEELTENLPPGQSGDSTSG